ncbi:cellulose biosynthesis cyclic di-GMP-binding regulatory protein BcsB [Affinirhizobium pseudoryzae]|uniref:cellulose biosynthesis cyclic di-GMP-binding regulatory protein BcsB n=1 Tax=Allorhizobium pseudoryzae TaxID=379684 RepID=UPI0013ED3155|nr:cellulose biosynthesis cyclic di-GMP-binding regulatory protein BcsB [Allorhizobium pseudoryzae]
MRNLALLGAAVVSFSLQASMANADTSLLPADMVTDTAGIALATPASAVQSAVQMTPFVEAASAMRLIGEDDTRRLSFYLAADQAAKAGTLRIAYTNAVSVLPDGASLAVSVNGHPVSSLPIRSPQGITTQDMKVEPALLQPGWNTVTLRARQHHRVDCSLDAVYELWTQIDAVQSGFMAATKVPDGDPAVLMTAGRTAAGSTELRVIGPSASVENLARQAMPVIQSLALLLGRNDLKVVFAEASSGKPGIDLYLGDPSSKIQSAETRAVLAAAPGGLSIQDRGNGAVRVVLRGSSEQAVATALVHSVNGPFQPILSGAQALRQTSVITTDQPGRTRLADLGYTSEPFAGRLFRTSVAMVMPEDFYPGDYASIALRLSAATAPKLAPGAQLLVRVNDKAVTSHALYAPDGATLRDKPIDLPLRAFHPGVNKVDILAELPREDDKTCDLTARNEERPRFLLLSDTAFDIPALARAGRLPDLAAFAGRAYPFNQRDRMDVYVDRASPLRLGSAATILTRLALSARHPLAADLRLGAPTGDLQSTALVVTAGGREMTELDGKNLRTARFAAAGFDSMTTGSVTERLGVPGSDAGSEMQALLQAFQQRTADERSDPSVLARIMNGLQRGSDMVGRWLEYRDVADQPPHYRPDEVLATISQTGNGSHLASVTTVTAATEEDLAQGVDALTEPSAWQTLRGGSALVRRSDLSVVTAEPPSYSFYPLTDTSIGNLRRLTAAWLSDHFLVYVGLILLLIGSFGLWLGYIVPRKGVRTVR